MRLNVDFIKEIGFSNGGVNQLQLIEDFTKYGNLISRNLCNIKIKDYTNGFRAVKTCLYEGVNLKENDFSIIMEEIYFLKTKILTVAEFNTKIGQRKLEQTESSFNYNLYLIFKYFKYSLFIILKSQILNIYENTYNRFKRYVG